MFPYARGKFITAESMTRNRGPFVLAHAGVTGCDDANASRDHWVAKGFAVPAATPTAREREQAQSISKSERSASNNF